MKLENKIYEPEHEEGVTCWCKPTTTVNNQTQKVYIDHNEQRKVIPDLIISILEDVEEHASHQDDDSEIAGMYRAVEMIRHNLGLNPVDN